MTYHNISWPKKCTHLWDILLIGSLSLASQSRIWVPTVTQLLGHADNVLWWSMAGALASTVTYLVCWCDLTSARARVLSIYKKDEKRLKYQANSKTQRNKWPSKHRSGTQASHALPEPPAPPTQAIPPAVAPHRLSRRRFLALLLDLPLFWPCTSLSPSLKLISTSETLPDGWKPWWHGKGGKISMFWAGRIIQKYGDFMCTTVNFGLNWDTNHVQPTRNDFINQVKEGRDFKLADSKLHFYPKNPLAATAQV